MLIRNQVSFSLSDWNLVENIFSKTCSEIWLFGQMSTYFCPYNVCYFIKVVCQCKSRFLQATYLFVFFRSFWKPGQPLYEFGFLFRSWRFVCHLSPPLPVANHVGRLNLWLLCEAKNCTMYYCPVIWCPADTLEMKLTLTIGTWRSLLLCSIAILVVIYNTDVLEKKKNKALHNILTKFAIYKFEEPPLWGC